MNNPSFSRPTAAGYCLLELALTASVAFALWRLAQPLALPGVAEGLGGRYAGVAAPLWPVPLDWALHPLAKPARALWLNRHAGLWLDGLAMAGWLALWVARRQRPGAGWVCLALWLLAATPYGPFGWPPLVWLGLALSSCLGYLAQALFSRRAAPPAGCSASLAGALGWPGWAGFSGLGLLWVCDFAARGPTKCAFFGVYQADALWLANVLLALAAVGRDSWMAGLARWAAGLDEFSRRRRAGALLFITGLGLALLLGWVGRSHNARWPGLASPHVSGELLRAWACLGWAYFAYRVGEWACSPARAQRALLGLFASGVCVAAGLGFSGDSGPALVILLAGLPTLGLPWLHGALRQRQGGKAWLLALLLAGAGFASWSYAVERLAPALSPLAQEREAALADPFHASSPYLAQLDWLLDAAPAFGFGLGRVPWCGALAQVGARACGGDGPGAPRQLASDYATAGLAAVFGVPGALALLAGLCAWLLSLTLCRNAADAPPWARLQAWVVLAFALCALAQTFLTAGASFGWLPLTGVTLPVLGYGGVSLCVAGIWLGWALNPADRRGRL